jgi:ABC-type bacteriocin/lantibiotic exporter with double-glycine peptidase domain
MKLIQRKNKNDCGICCIAMLLDIDYQEALAIMHPSETNDYTSNYYHFDRIFSAFNIKWTLHQDKKFLSLKKKNLLVFDYGEDIRHMVVFDPKEKLIFDPADKKPIKINQNLIEYVKKKLLSRIEI